MRASPLTCNTNIRLLFDQCVPWTQTYFRFVSQYHFLFSHLGIRPSPDQSLDPSFLPLVIYKMQLFIFFVEIKHDVCSLQLRLFLLLSVQCFPASPRPPTKQTFALKFCQHWCLPEVAKRYFQIIPPKARLLHNLR